MRQCGTSKCELFSKVFYEKEILNAGLYGLAENKIDGCQFQGILEP